jgi:hypothetical protein
MSAGGASAAAAAAAQRRRREEEETMSGYTHADLSEGWEFKILSSGTGQFRKPEVLRQALEEEARAGWVLVEKFDNQRLRLKRPASARTGDAALGYDPYRTTYGMSEVKLVFMILGCVFGFMGLLGLIAFIATHP